MIDNYLRDDGDEEGGEVNGADVPETTDEE